jgi:hypothetical protein
MYIIFHYRLMELWSKINTLVARVQRVATVFQYTCIAGCKTRFWEIRNGTRWKVTSFASRNNGEIAGSSKPSLPLLSFFPPPFTSYSSSKAGSVSYFNNLDKHNHGCLNRRSDGVLTLIQAQVTIKSNQSRTVRTNYQQGSGSTAPRARAWRFNIMATAYIIINTLPNTIDTQ